MAVMKGHDAQLFITILLQTLVHKECLDVLTIFMSEILQIAADLIIQVIGSVPCDGNVYYLILSYLLCNAHTFFYDTAI